MQKKAFKKIQHPFLIKTLNLDTDIIPITEKQLKIPPGPKYKIQNMKLLEEKLGNTGFGSDL